MIESIAHRIAAKRGIEIRGRTTLELIRCIQLSEGNFPCFGTCEGFCDQLSCLWREGCLRLRELKPHERTRKRYEEPRQQNDIGWPRPALPRLMRH